MRIGFIGCVESSKIALNTLLESSIPDVEVVAVITKKESSFNADFVDLAPLCSRYEIPVHFENSKRKDLSFEFMESYKPEIIFCIGWSYLLNDAFLTMTKHGVIGFHPAALPKNRGRHPIIWALALGLKETASTFFKIDKGADTGPILSQVKINIDFSDDANSLYSKITARSQQQIIDFTKQLINGSAEFIPQTHSQASVWRKRSRKDGIIDWRMSAESIYNLIRALTRPYPGAEFAYKEKFLQVWRSKVCAESYPFNVEPGFVLDVKAGCILVKCAGSSALWLLDVELEEIKIGQYL